MDKQRITEDLRQLKDEELVAVLRDVFQTDNPLLRRPDIAAIGFS